jgi:DNA-binding transcriptional ArsR family regulator
LVEGDAECEEKRIDRVFFALSDPVRRRILERLDEESQLVSELAAPFDIQAVSRHIQVLVQAGAHQAGTDRSCQPVQSGCRTDL